MFEYFYKYGILNAIIVQKHNENLEIFSCNQFERKAAEKIRRIGLENKMTLDDFFPDKLNDLKGFEYRVLCKDEYPNIYSLFMNNIYYIGGSGKRFIDTIAEHQNASVSFIFVEAKTTTEAWNLFLKVFRYPKFDFTINIEMTMVENYPGLVDYVYTFETDAFCAILPYPERKSFFSFVMKPFDSWVWLLIGTSVTCLAIFWYVINKHSSISNPNSTGYFVFAFVTFFLGQGVGFRDHTKVQTLLIYLMFFLTFIFGNLYQSALTSLMTESRVGDKLTTVQGMIDSNFTFHVDPMFAFMLNDSTTHKNFIPKITKNVEKIKNLNFKELSSQKVGIILSCTHINNIYKTNIDGNVIDYYYRMPEKFYSYYSKFPTTAYSPYGDRLQEYSLKIHESGIKQRWNSLSSFSKYEDIAAVKKREQIINEEFLLKLDDMTGAFYCLGIGSVVALIGLVLEFFWFYNLRHLKQKMIARPKRRCWARRNRVAPIQTRVRFIQVQPRA